MNEQMLLFSEEVGTWPYPAPCPIREGCINYQCHVENGGGCGGERAICTASQLACGRWLSESQWELMSNYERKRLKRIERVI